MQNKREEHKKTIIGVIGTHPHITLTQVIEEYLKSNEGTLDDTIDEIVKGLNFESVTVEINGKDDYHGTRRNQKKY